MVVPAITAAWPSGVAKVVVNPSIIDWIDGAAETGRTRGVVALHPARPVVLDSARAIPITIDRPPIAPRHG